MDAGKARETTNYLLGRLGVDREGDVLGQLERVSTFRILALQREIGLSRRAFPLVGDDVILPSDPMAALAERSDVDILIGTTSEEDRLFAVTGWAPPARDLGPTLARYIGDPGLRAEAEAIYAPMLRELGGDQVALTHLIATDHSWTEPARRLAAVHAAASGRSYLYQFTWASSALQGRVGAAHLVDLPFFFDNLDAPGVMELLGDAGRQETAARLAHGMSAALAGFMRSGNPSGPLGEWPAFTPSRRATMELGAASGVEIDRLAKRLDFWARNRGKAAPALSTIGEA
jgi:para-nitrobenzyl esterase